MQGERHARTSTSSSMAAAVRRFAKLAGVLVFFFAAPCHATPFDLSGQDWEGCSELVRLARAEVTPGRVVATTQLDFHDRKPEDGVILLYPEHSLDVEELSGFMRAGGRVVLLDDYGRGDGLL